MRFQIVIVLLCSVFMACKARQPGTNQNASEAKQLFANDLPGGRDSWREVGLEPKQVPFIFVVDDGCTGFILDTERQLAMTAYHCQVAVGTPLFFNDNLRRKPTAPPPPATVVKGQITAILEKSPVGELDYVIFSYKMNDPSQQVYLRGVKLAGPETSLETFYRGQNFIYLTGYPNDKEARARLSRSKCNIRSGIGAPQYIRDNFNWYKTLLSNWEAPGSIYMQNLAEYQAMRECFSEITLKNYERFHYDCSVYGGNSGGPVYFETQSDIVVIGLPGSYIPDEETLARMAQRASCRPQYKAKYFVPLPFTGTITPPANNGVPQTWNNSNRDTDKVSTMPLVVPMSKIVEQSLFLKGHPDLLY